MADRRVEAHHSRRPYRRRGRRRETGDLQAHLGADHGRDCNPAHVVGALRSDRALRSRPGPQGRKHRRYIQPGSDVRGVHPPHCPWIARMSKPTTVNAAMAATRTDRVAGFRASVRTWAARPTNQTFARNIGILLLVGIVFSLTTDRFLTVENLTNVLRQVSFVGISSCAVTLVMVAGRLDLSVGSVVAIAGVVAAKFAADAGWPLGAAFGMGILAGGGFGSLNAFLVVSLRINPVISTLGTLYLGRRIALLLAGGEPVKGVPLTFNDLATSTIGPISTPVFIFAVVAAAMFFIERKTLLGRWAVASGGNTHPPPLPAIPLYPPLIIPSLLPR